MLAIRALSGKSAEPMTTLPPAAAAEPEPDAAAEADVGAALELASGSEELPQAVKASAAARPAATIVLPRVRVDRTDTGTPCVVWADGGCRLSRSRLVSNPRTVLLSLRYCCHSRAVVVDAAVCAV